MKNPSSGLNPFILFSAMSIYSGESQPKILSAQINTRYGGSSASHEWIKHQIFDIRVILYYFVAQFLRVGCQVLRCSLRIDFPHVRPFIGFFYQTLIKNVTRIRSDDLINQEICWFLKYKDGFTYNVRFICNWFAMLIETTITLIAAPSGFTQTISSIYFHPIVSINEKK
ncbi:MAG: hypothetical protein CM15mV26_1080 [uncultured marine virus]|nr:MAG: hypothetical protein CM15mV26_1080 [uncultured marine virus]